MRQQDAKTVELVNDCMSLATSAACEILDLIEQKFKGKKIIIADGWASKAFSAAIKELPCYKNKQPADRIQIRNESGQAVRLRVYVFRQQTELLWNGKEISTTLFRIDEDGKFLEPSPNVGEQFARYSHSEYEKDRLEYERLMSEARKIERKYPELANFTR